MKNIDFSKVKPSPGMMLVKIDKQENKTKSGLLLTADAGLPQTGTVISIGQELKFPQPAEVGDKVIYEKFSINDFPSGEDTYRFIKFESVLGTIKE